VDAAACAAMGWQGECVKTCERSNSERTMRCSAYGEVAWVLTPPDAASIFGESLEPNQGFRQTYPR